MVEGCAPVGVPSVGVSDHRVEERRIGGESASNRRT
jgi:hypothetical protein